MADFQKQNSKIKHETVLLSEEEQDDTILYVLEKSFENVIHDILASVHRTEKISRMQSAVIEAELKAEKVSRQIAAGLGHEESTDGTSSMPTVETPGAAIKDGKAYLKGNPLKTTKKIICPNCKLPRLLYPRVGHGARDPPDPRQQYCKNEPPIFIDKHDVHGQRKKGTKLKGPPKGKPKKNEPASPASSNASAPSTPANGSFQSETFEFRIIEVPAAKCPNRESEQGDHWKTVTQMANHLNGNCFLKRDRAAGREAVAKMASTPADSRPTSPKPGNGVRRNRLNEDNDVLGRKKQKLDIPKKNGKKAGTSPSKLRDGETAEMNQEPGDEAEITDSIKLQVKIKKPDHSGGDRPETSGDLLRKTEINGVKDSNAKLKHPKLNHKTS